MIVPLHGISRSVPEGLHVDKCRSKYCGHTRYAAPNEGFGWMGENQCDICGRTYPMPSLESSLLGRSADSPVFTGRGPRSASTRGESGLHKLDGDLLVLQPGCGSGGPRPCAHCPRSQPLL
jgi:hypothetical protein